MKVVWGHCMNQWPISTSFLSSEVPEIHRVDMVMVNREINKKDTHALGITESFQLTQKALLHGTRSTCGMCFVLQGQGRIRVGGPPLACIGSHTEVRSPLQNSSIFVWIIQCFLPPLQMDSNRNLIAIWGKSGSMI